MSKGIEEYYHRHLLALNRRGALPPSFFKQGGSIKPPLPPGSYAPVVTTSPLRGVTMSQFPTVP